MSEMQMGMSDMKSDPRDPRTGIEDSLEYLDRKNSDLSEVITFMEDKFGPFLRNDVDVPGDGMKSADPTVSLESDHQQAIRRQVDRTQVSVNRLRSILERFDR